MHDIIIMTLTAGEKVENNHYIKSQRGGKQRKERKKGNNEQKVVWAKWDSIPQWIMWLFIGCFISGCI